MKKIHDLFSRHAWTICVAAAAATGMSAPIIVGAAANDHRPTGKPPAAVAQAPTLNTPGVQWLAALNGIIHSSPSGKLPGGCAMVTSYRICAPRVSVDGQQLSDVTLVEEMLRLATRPSSNRAPSAADAIAALETPRIQNEAVARAVADRLLYQRGLAITTGLAALATAMAHQQLGYYLSYPAAGEADGIVPKGMSATEYFLSPPVVAGYERIIAIGREETVLAASHVSVATWIGQQLSSHVILVNGASPTFSVAQVFAAAQ